MKKIIMAALAGATMLASAGSAQAATTATQPAGLKFTVGGACTLSASQVKLTNFVIGDTVAKYATREGQWDNGSVVSTPTGPNYELANVQCPSGVAWAVKIQGAANYNLISVQNSSQTEIFQAIPISDTVDGVAQVAQIIGNTPSTDQAFGSGNGNAQSIKGHYMFFSGDKTTVFQAGDYTGSATATLTY